LVRNISDVAVAANVPYLWIGILSGMIIIVAALNFSSVLVIAYALRLNRMNL